MSISDIDNDHSRNIGIVADNIPSLCWLADDKGSIYWYNMRWYEYTGTTPEDMYGWGWKSVHHPKVLADVLIKWVNCLSTGDSFEMIFPIKGNDGIFRPFLTRVVPIKKEGTITSWFGCNIEVGGIFSNETYVKEWQQLQLKMVVTDV